MAPSPPDCDRAELCGQAGTLPMEAQLQGWVHTHAHLSEERHLCHLPRHVPRWIKCHLPLGNNKQVVPVKNF